MRIFLSASAILMAAPPALSQQSFYCPPPEDVWVVEKEFPEAPAWQYEARVRGHWVADARVMRRPVPNGPSPTEARIRGTPAARSSRPRAAPMLTHDRAVTVDDGSIGADELMPLPPVMAAREWLRVEESGDILRCRYRLDDGRGLDARFPTAVDALIPINRQSCTPNSAGWGFDAALSVEQCNTSRTGCLFICAETPVLESW
ncbi:hypothetical protein [Hyphobacterium sp.]|jgi:hypothetical protein|uniref:hypothetical protein n=1 Tax=Hyphobacterium sp. TaxID=2004662 RepID=UPI003BAC2482